MVSVNYHNLIIICLHTVIRFQVFPPYSNNLHTVIWFQVAILNKKYFVHSLKYSSLRIITSEILTIPVRKIWIK